jgi:hypothetical protein
MTQASSQTFRRNQVEQALWKFATLDRQSHHEPNSAFKARVKHLLDLDRSGVVFQRAKVAPKVDRALGSGASEGTGTDAQFTLADTVCLGLALDMLRAGFKQGEVLLIVGYLRPSLENRVIGEILLSQPEIRPAAPRRQARPESEQPDRRVFLVLNRVEAGEEFAAFNLKRPNVPILKEPRICKGLGELSTALSEMDHMFRRAIVFEIGYLVAAVNEFLPQIQPAKRGPRS